MACIACHTDYPVLTPFGRQFKLSGYTMSADQTELPPLAVMLQPSYSHTQKSQPGGAGSGFADNNNAALTQASVFYAGRLFGPYAKDLFSPDVASVVNKVGVFLQATYDGIEESWAWDNAEVRFASTTSLGEQSLGYGFYANNNPTMEDPWNTTPAWGYPFTGSGLAPSPAAATLIDGGLAQQVVGVGAYAMYANTLYLNVAGYHTLGANTQQSLGVDPAGETQVPGMAPYWRVALQHPLGNGTWEVGTFGMVADTYPGRDASAGKDRIEDFGFDTQYETSFEKNDITVMLSWIYERQNWNASQALGGASNAADTLRNFKATVDYLYDKTYGCVVQYFAINGDHDALLYSGSANGSPDSDGFIFQLNYLPFNKNGGPAFWPRSNVKFSLQYVMYNKFDGARTNYDGTGRDARDNNTLYLEAWIAF